MVGTILDIETTGFSGSKDELLEVGLMRIDTETKDVLSYDNLYFWKEGYPVGQTTHIHGLTTEFLRDYYEKNKVTQTGLTLFEENIVKLSAYFYGSIVIGKNSNNFDIPFLHKWVARATDGMFHFEKWRMGIPIDMQVEFSPKYQILAGISGNKKGTLSEYIEVIPRGKELTDRLYNSLEIGRGGRAHTALYDVCMTYVVYCYWKKPWKN